MSGIFEQIQQNNELFGNENCKEVTEDDFIEVMKMLTKRRDDEEGIVFITGVGGYLTWVFKQFGKTKLPRKLKKRIYLTKKLRKIHIPQYYETK